MPSLKSMAKRVQWVASDVWFAGKRKLGLGKKSFEKAMNANPRKIKPAFVPARVSRVMGEAREIQDAAFREIDDLGLTVMPKYKPFSTQTISTVEFGNASTEQIQKALEIAEAAKEKILPKVREARAALGGIDRKLKESKKKAYATNRFNRKKRRKEFTRLDGLDFSAWDDYQSARPLIFDVIRELKAKLEEENN